MDASADHPSLGPYVGVDERGAEAAANTVSEALNLDFDEDGFCRRAGRQRLGVTAFPGCAIVALGQYLEPSGNRRIVWFAAKRDGSDSGLPQMGYVPDGGLGTSDFQAVVSPFTDADPSGQLSERFSLRASAIQFKGQLIVTTARGSLCYYATNNGVPVIWRIPAVAGNDALSGVVGARSYLAAPPRADILTVWRNRLVAIQGQSVGLSMDADDPNVPLSAPVGAACVWPGSTNFSVLSEEADEITAAAIRYDRLELYTKRSVYLVDEDDSGPVARRAQQQRGCIAPKSLVNTGDLSFFLSDGAICSFDGTSVREISDALPKTLARINWIAATRAVGVHFKRKHEYRLWVPIDGSPWNDLCLIYDYRKNRWRHYAGWITTDTLAARTAAPQYRVTAAASVISPAGEEIIVTGNYDGELWLEDAGRDDRGSVFPAFIVSQIIGKGSSRMAWGDLRVNCQHDGSIIQGRLLIEGESTDQALARAPDASVRAIRPELPTYDATPAWGFSPSEDHFDFVKLPLAEVAGEARMLLTLPGTDGTVTDLAAGAVRWAEFSSHPRPGRTP